MLSLGDIWSLKMQLYLGNHVFRVGEHRCQGAYTSAILLEQGIKMVSTGQALKFKNITILLFRLQLANIFRKLFFQFLKKTISAHLLYIASNYIELIRIY